MNDIVLLTVDCLRSDAISRMLNLMSQIENQGWNHSTTFATSHSTKWSCAAFLTGRFYTEVFDQATRSATAGDHLASVLSDQGYTTGAFIAGNPNVNEYLSAFDRSWNAKYESMDHKSGASVFLSRASKLLKAKKEIPAQDILNRAKRWYKEQSSPRFLWIHLMEPHQPYLPGFRQALSEGLLKTYRSAICQYRKNGELSKRELDRLESLYWRTVSALDETLVENLDWMKNDTKFLFTADHGESFSHGRAGHHGWKDDVMKVPIVSNTPIDGVLDLRYIPQTILSAVDLPTPDSMKPKLLTDEDMHPAFGGAGDPTIVVLNDELAVKSELTTSDGNIVYRNAHTDEVIENLPESLNSAIEELRTSVNSSGFIGKDSEEVSDAVSERLKDLGYA